MDFSPSPCRPRTPTGVARRSGRLPPLRGPCLAAQRRPSPPSGRAGTAVGATPAVPGLPGQRLAPAARRHLPPATPDLPGAGGRPVRALHRFAGPVPAPVPGCGVGAATLWRDVQAVAPGRTPDPQAALPPHPGLPGRCGTPEPGQWPTPGQAPYPGRARRHAPDPLHGHRVCGPAQPRHPGFPHTPVRQGQTQEGGPCRRHAQAAGHVEHHHAGPGAVAKRTRHKAAPYLTFNTVTGPGPAAHPATPGPGTTAGGGARAAGAPGGRDAEPRASAAGGADAAGRLVERRHEPVRSRGTPRCPPRPTGRGLVGSLRPRARLTRGARTEAGAPASCA